MGVQMSIHPYDCYDVNYAILKHWHSNTLKYTHLSNVNLHNAESICIFFELCHEWHFFPVLKIT